MDEKHMEVIEKILREIQDIKVILQENMGENEKVEE